MAIGSAHNAYGAGRAAVVSGSHDGADEHTVDSSHATDTPAERFRRRPPNTIAEIGTLPESNSGAMQGSSSPAR